eukprot:14583974-Alexandrium_andersonii.AAC.1
MKRLGAATELGPAHRTGLSAARALPQAPRRVARPRGPLRGPCAESVERIDRRVDDGALAQTPELDCA